MRGTVALVDNGRHTTYTRPSKCWWQRCQSSRFRRVAPDFTSEIRHPVWDLNPLVFFIQPAKFFLTYLTHVSLLPCKTSLNNCNHDCNAVM